MCIHSAGRGKGPGGLQRVGVVIDLPAVVSLLKPHNASATQIDARDDLKWHWRVCTTGFQPVRTV